MKAHTAMKKLALALFAVTVSGAASAATHALPYSFKADPANLPSVQRGAKAFMNYCSGCHSMKYMRYSRVGQDLGIPEDLLKANLMFTSEKTGDHILSSMPKDASKNWFGQTPPDLSLETRARGQDWVYSYLKSFYVDPARPLGVNNLVLPGASMPHVLWELQGWQQKKAEGHEGAPAEAEEHGHASPFEAAAGGKLSGEEYDKFTADLVNFMTYASEPGRAARVALGPKAIVYLLILLGFAYLLKKEYWRDVH